MVLGIIGGALDALLGLLTLLGGRFIARFLTEMGATEPDMQVGASIVTGAITIAGFLLLAVAALGIAGGLNAKSRPILGGVLMLVASVLNFFGGWPGVIIGLVLVLGGILTLVGAKEAQAPAQ